MIEIISISDAQKMISKLPDIVKETPYILTKNGKGTMVVLPFFNGCDKLIDEYMEDYEMDLNRDELIKRFKESYESGPSDLVI